MAVEHVKSTPITNLDALPIVKGTEGEGAPGLLKSNEGYALIPASSSADSTFQLVRIPSTAKVKSLIFESEAMAAGKFDVGLYYATDGVIGKTTSLLASAAIDQDFFATDIDCASAVVPTEIINESGTYTSVKRNQPIWQAAGLTSDPGGNFDICLTVHTTAVTTGAAYAGARCVYTD